MKLIQRAPAITRYGSFIPALEWLFSHFRPKRVLEFGCGYYSTAFFLKHCQWVLSLEMTSPAWHHIFQQAYTAYPNSMIIMSHKHGYEDLDNYLQENVDFAFVDGHDDTRCECVMAMFGRCDILAAHDYDLEDHNFHEKVVTPKNYCLFRYREYAPHTGFWIEKKRQKLIAAFLGDARFALAVPDIK